MILLTIITKKYQVNKSRKSTSTMYFIIVGLMLLREKTISLLLNILCTGMCYEQVINQQIKCLMTINNNQTS